MAKRKLSETLDVETTAKRAEKGKKRRVSKDANRTTSTTSAAGRSINGAPSPETNTNAVHIEARESSPQPPEGLSKGQRKRWRKRRRRRDGKSRPAEQNGVLDLAAPGPLPVQYPQWQPKEKRKDRALVDRSAVLQLATTCLVPWKAKVLKDDRPAQATSRTLDHLTYGGDHSGTSRQPRNLDTGSAETKKRPSVPVPSAGAAAPTAAKATDFHTSSSSTSSQASQHQRQRSKSKDAIQLRVHKAHAPSLLAIGFRKPSFGGKATSVPSHINTSDVHAAFKRFSAFVNGGESENSGKEDDSSDDDAEEGVRRRRATGSFAESLPIHANTVRDERKEVEQVAFYQGKSAVNNESATSRLADGVIVLPADVSSPRDSPADAGEESGLPDAQLTSNSSWPANVGIKRQSSFLGLETGGAQSATVSAPPVANKPMPASIPDPFDVSEADTKAALEALDEISEGMLTVTRPIPASKLEMRPDSGDFEETKELMELDFSARLAESNLMGDFGYSQDSPVQTDGSHISVTCYAARIPDGKDGSSMQGQLYASVTASRSSMSENIHVTMPCPAAPQSDSSSSLSELSRSPSTPTPTARVGQASVGDGERSPMPENAVDTVVASDPPPAKKRKMTGRTSKHFTPQKQARQKIAPAVAQVAQSPDGDLVDAEESGTPGNANDRAESELKSAFRAETAIKAVRRPTRRSVAAKMTQSSEQSALDEHPEEAVDEDANNAIENGQTNSPQLRQTPTSSPIPAKRKTRKSTGKKSTYFTPTRPALDPNIIDRVDFYNTTSSGRKARVPAGISIAPVPPIHSPYFGIIQEKLWREPFWLLIAVTFLNKTTGRAAAPVFWKLKEKYNTPEGLADADEEELIKLIWNLGLQTQRARRCIRIAKAWVDHLPQKGRRPRTMHYPCKGDGKKFKRGQIVEEDADDVGGALEIGHIPGCGPYAWDSWRIFCRDVLRGVAEDYNGEGAGSGEDGEAFVPEWKKVVPLDKELRACLRWMWLREGWIWDIETGEKREATEEEMERAVKGEMEISDPQERKFAAQAAGVEIVPDNKDAQQQPSAAEMDGADSSTDAGSNIVVAVSTGKLVRPTRRSA